MSPPVEMTSSWVNRSSGFSSTWVGRKAHDLSGRDDKFVGELQQRFFIHFGCAVRPMSPPVLMNNGIGGTRSPTAGPSALLGRKTDLLALETTADPSTPLRSGRDDKGKIGGEGER